MKRSVAVVLGLLCAGHLFIACQGAEDSPSGDDDQSEGGESGGSSGGTGGKASQGGAGGEDSGGSGGSDEGQGGTAGNDGAGEGGTAGEDGEGGSGGTGGSPNAGGTGGSPNAGGSGGVPNAGGSGGMPGAGGAGGADDVIVVPPGGKSAAEQEAAVQEFKKVAKVTSEKKDGLYTLIRVETDNTVISKFEDKHLKMLAGFNALQRLELVNPKVSLSATKVVETLPVLNYLGYQYIGNSMAIGPDFMLTAEAHKSRLIGLSFKHMFKMTTATKVGELGIYPKLQYVVFDHASAGPEGAKFLVKNPSIIGLELHRTTMNREQLRSVAKALVNLECLHIKNASKDDITYAFSGHPKLKVLWPHEISMNLPGVTVVSKAASEPNKPGYSALCRVSQLRPHP
ncbi:MAG: hypothetical protein KA712_01380 [Myxococcales bacterium]|nr:hypothetical protein [Myxococcales bacterium]